ncbi:MAG: HypC/HybG/HupF family hydrogenase formation chaperone [Berryella intestinalis]|uniref:HypC/HybG/HupF family hydrogenase formation chaperone n=1 Tax=Berryella intestinalis TaxID=1531429 RepID=UPI002A508CE8|nr:HypC/HybG/HupF family hydrogenase formation chaperone [Berryella intestinalis]MDD7368406.1 HypC/HybG/HupF family hydrogenase formation chaperone [Berryella intestinalis]MDY3129726.1 HypC/HybG/HupF family hydrogenase formation chaperone [Berryella intestinalis]
MCLAIPARITELKENNMAEVSIMGTTRDISIDLTPQAGLGDYVLVHAGFSIEVVGEAYAKETLALIDEMSELVDDFEASPQAAVR